MVHYRNNAMHIDFKHMFGDNTSIDALSAKHIRIGFYVLLVPAYDWFRLNTFLAAEEDNDIILAYFLRETGDLIPRSCRWNNPLVLKRQRPLSSRNHCTFHTTFGNNSSAYRD